MSINKPNATERKTLGLRIDAQRNKRGLTLKELATKAGCGEKSVRNVIKGRPTRGKIISEILTALELVAEDAKPILVSDNDHGGYTRDSFADYIGRYFAYRRSFSFPRNIVRSIFDISWNDQDNCLHFIEDQRYDSTEMDSTVDHSQSGEIFISHTMGLLHFVTKAKGAVRLITVSQFRLNDPEDLLMRGIVLTQAKRPLHYQPSAAAIIFEKAKPITGLHPVRLTPA